MDNVTQLSVDTSCASGNSETHLLTHADPADDADALFMKMMPAFAQALENMEHRLTQQIIASAKIIITSAVEHSKTASPPSSPSPRSRRPRNPMRSGTAPNLPTAEGHPTTPDNARSRLPLVPRRQSGSQRHSNPDVADAGFPKLHNITTLAEALSRLHTPEEQAVDTSSPTCTATNILIPQPQTGSRRPSNLSGYSSQSSNCPLQGHISFEALEKECDDNIIITARRRSRQTSNGGSENNEACSKEREPSDNASKRNSLSDASIHFTGIIQHLNKIAPASPHLMPHQQDFTKETPPAPSSSLASSVPVRSESLTSMQELRQNELVDLAMRRHEPKHIELKNPAWLYFSGILPCFGGMNRFAVLALLVVSMGFSLSQLIMLQDEGTLNETCSAKLCMQDTLTPILALGIGCFLKVVMSCLLNDQVVGTSEGMLTYHLKEIGALGTWHAIARRDMAKMMTCWVCMVLACICTSFGWERDVSLAAVHVAAYAFTTHVFMGLAYNILHICRGLFLGIDNFCIQIVTQRECENAVEDWNIFQAILRRVCVPVARSFILLLTSTLAALILPIIISNNFVSLLPGACALLVVMWVSFYIGDITSKCDRVGAFINMLDFGEKFDFKRQYVVEYINNSRAGFYMFDVRVTGGMVVKFTYVGFVLAAAVATRILSE